MWGVSVVISDKQFIEMHFQQKPQVKSVEIKVRLWDWFISVHACVCLCEYVKRKRSAAVISPHVYLVLMYAFKLLTLRFSAWQVKWRTNTSLDWLIVSLWEDGTHTHTPLWVNKWCPPIQWQPLYPSFHLFHHPPVDLFLDQISSKFRASSAESQMWPMFSSSEQTESAKTTL